MIGSMYGMLERRRRGERGLKLNFSGFIRDDLCHPRSVEAGLDRPRANLPIRRNGRSKGYAQAKRRRLGKESQSAALGVTAIRAKERILSGHERCNLKMKRLSALWLSREFES